MSDPKVRRAILKAFLIAFAIVCSSYVFLYGATRHLPQRTYTGIRILNASDFNQHASWIAQGREGHWMIRNLYTSIPHEGFLFRPIYFALSFPFHWTSISNPAALHIIRIFCGVVLLILLFPLMRLYLLEEKRVLVAFLLIAFTSGLGILFHKPEAQSADLGIPESVLFLSLGEAPHFAFSLLLMWIGITCVYKSTENEANESRRLSIFAIVLLLLWFEHPFDAVIVTVVSFANLWQFPKKTDAIPYAIAMCVLGAAGFLYYQHIKALPAGQGWASSQNLMMSPAPYLLLSAFVPLLLFAIPATIRLWKVPERRKHLIFLWTWIVVQIFLAYAPFPFQRRLIAGVQLPFAMLAAQEISRFKVPAIVGLVLLFSATNIYFTAQQISLFRSGQMPFFLSDSYQQAFESLANSKESGAVLSAFTTGNFTPAYTGRQTFMGHSSLTPDIAARRAEAEAFYKAPSEEFLRKNNLRFVIYGLEERHLYGQSFRMNLPVFFKNDAVLIYKLP